MMCIADPEDEEDGEDGVGLGQTAAEADLTLENDV